MLMDTPDETLALAAQNGDRNAFAALVTRHYDRIYGLGWRLTGSAADAQDLAQEICAALPAKLAGFRHEARFTTWLYRVVVNAVADLRRRQMTRARAADGWGQGRGDPCRDGSGGDARSAGASGPYPGLRRDRSLRTGAGRRT